MFVLTMPMHQMVNILHASLVEVIGPLDDDDTFQVVAWVDGKEILLYYTIKGEEDAMDYLHSLWEYLEKEGKAIPGLLPPFPSESTGK